MAKPASGVGHGRASTWLLRSSAVRVTPAVLPPVSCLIHSSPPVVASNCSAASPLGLPFLGSFHARPGDPGKATAGNHLPNPVRRSQGYAAIGRRAALCVPLILEQTPVLQAKLLRVLQGARIRTCGRHAPLPGR